MLHIPYVARPIAIPGHGYTFSATDLIRALSISSQAVCRPSTARCSNSGRFLNHASQRPTPIYFGFIYFFLNFYIATRDATTKDLLAEELERERLLSRDARCLYSCASRIYLQLRFISSTHVFTMHYTIHTYTHKYIHT